MNSIPRKKESTGPPFNSLTAYSTTTLGNFSCFHGERLHPQSRFTERRRRQKRRLSATFGDSPLKPRLTRAYSTPSRLSRSRTLLFASELLSSPSALLKKSRFRVPVSITRSGDRTHTSISSAMLDAAAISSAARAGWGGAK